MVNLLLARRECFFSLLLYICGIWAPATGISHHLKTFLVVLVCDSICRSTWTSPSPWIPTPRSSSTPVVPRVLPKQTPFSPKMLGPRNPAFPLPNPRTPVGPSGSTEALFRVFLFPLCFTLIHSQRICVFSESPSHRDGHSQPGITYRGMTPS